MGKMSELDAAIRELQQCGEALLAAACALRQQFIGEEELPAGVEVPFYIPDECAVAEREMP